MISNNIKKISDRIETKCAHLGRDGSEITLIAVSKNFGVDEIREALNCGIKNFGENKAQELKEKFEILKDDVIWHFVGHLQTNKVKYAVKAANYIHSVDSIKLAAEINRTAEKLQKKINVLLEIKTSEEATKVGLSDFDKIIETAEFCNKSDFLNLKGLMTIAPFTDDEKEVRKSFIELRTLKEKMNLQGFNLTELSMGMTSDFEIALEEGATMLRIGTAIFGHRSY